MKTPNAFGQAANIPKQVVQAILDFVEDTGATISLAMALGTFIASTAGKLSLQKLWGNINALQLIVHLPLINLIYPAQVQGLFDRLISVVTFDVLEVFDEFELQTLPEFTPTEPLNINCDTVGYGSTNTMDNLGSINYLIALVLLRIVIFTVQRVSCSRGHAKLNRIMIDRENLAGGTLRFVLETYFDIFLIVILTFAPALDRQGVFYLEEWNRADKLSVVMQWFLVAVLIVFTMLTVCATLCCFKPGKTAGFHLHNKIILDLIEKVEESKKQRSDLQKEERKSEVQ